MNGEGIKFVPKEIGASPNAMAALEATADALNTYLTRHFQGDWGEADEATKEGNDRILAEIGELVSLFTTRGGVRLCLVTKIGAISTTALLAEEVEEATEEASHDG